ncbi:surface lipoprotein assembly modifier [Moraxella sp. ZY210820]|uniref:surface lipoprotein assembly modifier n=1 Tax=unclassified Moraxella TaxID=2685852 RepID=UPI00273049FD|nr:surface lipoprotein assembly modifier [Moraxella sp. ZY210820]WLF83674.1 surface lipoprotein assembly modifier [Moraxella sp. ZY210820]
MKKINLFILISTLQFSLNVSAQTLSQLDDRRLQDEKLQQYDTLPNTEMTPTVSIATTSSQQIHLDEQQLLQQPALLQHTLLSALTYHHVENSIYLLDLYQKLDKQYIDDNLLTWANAVKAEHQQRYLEAIHSYQQILEKYPQYDLLRLRLALVLLKQQHYLEAQQQFEQILANQQLAPALKQAVEQHLAQLKQRQRWQFSTDLTYMRDKNINNAPNNPNINAHWTAQQQQSAHGVQFALSTQKKYQLNQGFFLEHRWQTYGKYYWDSSHYNDVNARINVGLGKYYPRSSVLVLPFYEQNWYAGGNPQQHQLKAFSKSHGISLEAKHALTDKLLLGLHTEFAQNNYRTRPHLNGHGQYVALSSTYFANPQRYYYTAIDYQQVKTQDSDDSFQRHGIRLGVGQQWQSGINSYFAINYAQRKYQGAMPIFNIKQHSHDYGASLSLGHQKLQWHGISPRLTWQYQKVDSNIALYDYDKQKVFIEFAKHF